MADGVTVKVEGLRELRKQVLALSKALEPGKVEPVTHRGAQTVAARARARVKRGPDRKNRPGGTLQNAIVAKQLRRRGEEPAPSIAGVDRKKAPHAHWVEHGSAGDRVGQRKSTKSTLDYTGRRFGRMPAQPFLRPAFDESKRGVLEQITRDLRQRVDEAVTKP